MGLLDGEDIKLLSLHVEHELLALGGGEALYVPLADAEDRGVWQGRVVVSGVRLWRWGEEGVGSEDRRPSGCGGVVFNFDVSHSSAASSKMA